LGALVATLTFSGDANCRASSKSLRAEEIYFRDRFSPWVGGPTPHFYEELIFYVPTFLGGHSLTNRPKWRMHGSAQP
jgi:hypothetical protein